MIIHITVFDWVDENLKIFSDFFVDVNKYQVRVCKTIQEYEELESNNLASFFLVNVDLEEFCDAPYFSKLQLPILFYSSYVAPIFIEKLELKPNYGFLSCPFSKVQLNLQINTLATLYQQNNELNAQGIVLNRIEESLQSLNRAIQVPIGSSRKNLQTEPTDLNEMSILSKIGRNIVALMDFEPIIETVYRGLNKIMNAPILLIGKIQTASTNEIHLWGYEQKAMPIHRRVIKLNDEHRLSSWCVRNQKKIYINSFDQEVFSYISDRNVYYSDSNIPQSQIYMPLFVEKQMIGILIIKDFEPNSFTKGDVNILRNLAVYVSIAIKNAEIFQLMKVQNDSIKSSIQYGLTIQNIILPSISTIEYYYKSFIIYKPKDIVSGDFYWFTDKLHGSRVILAVIDCTGHGVPGAFMSMIANMLLNEIVIERKLFIPSKILEFLDAQLKHIMKLAVTEVNDGMDLSLCMFEKAGHGKTKLIFSGAKNNAHYYSNEKKELITLKADRRSICTHVRNNKIAFTDQEVMLDAGDMVYMTTDGYITQNNHSRKRFGSTRYVEILNRIAGFALAEQKQELESEFQLFKQNELLRDDITVMGVRV